MPIEIIAPGATDEQKQLALAAALAVFKVNKISPEAAAVARSEMTTYVKERGGSGPKPHPDSRKAALIFLQAQEAMVAVLGRIDGTIRVDLTDRWNDYIEKSEFHNWKPPSGRSTPQ